MTGRFSVARSNCVSARVCDLPPPVEHGNCICPRDLGYPRRAYLYYFILIMSSVLIVCSAFEQPVGTLVVDDAIGQLTTKRLYYVAEIFLCRQQPGGIFPRMVFV